MLPDPQVFQAAATVLDAVAGELSGVRERVWGQAQATHWVAPAARRIAGDLAQDDASVRTGLAELSAAAGYLRRLAGAVVELREAMRRAHDRQVDVLEVDLAAARRDPAQAGDAERLQAQRASLPGPQEPFCSGRVPVPQVPLPGVPAAGRVLLVALGPYGGVVSVDCPAVRALGGALEQLSGAVRAGLGRATAGTGGLPLGALGVYGLPGPAAGVFLAEVTGQGSALGRAAEGLAAQGGRAVALAGLVEAADTAGVGTAQQLLRDPRADRAVQLAALLAAGADPDALWAAVGQTSEQDLAWLMATVPGLTAELGEHKDEDGLPFSWVDVLDGLTGVTGAPAQIAEKAEVSALSRGQAAREIKPVAGSSQVQRRAYREAMRSMRASSGEAARWGSRAAAVPGGVVLEWLSQPLRVVVPMVDRVPVLRSVPGASVVMTGLGTAVDVQDGMSTEGAVAKNVASTAAGLGAAAATTALLAGTAVAATAAAPVLIAVGVGTAVSFGTGKVIEHYGDDIVDFGKGAGEAAVELGGDAVDLGAQAWDWAFG